MSASSDDNAVGELQLPECIRQHYLTAAAAVSDNESDKSSDSGASTVPVSESSDSSSYSSSDSSSDSSSSEEPDSESEYPESSSQHEDSNDSDSASLIGDTKVHNASDLSVREGVLVLMDLFMENKLGKKNYW